MNGTFGDGDFDVVCCSLEEWNDVWRRNQFLVREILKLRPDMRILFVEPPVDVLWSGLREKRIPPSGARRIVGFEPVAAYRPRKWLPRRLAAGVDDRLSRRVEVRAKRLGLRHPVLWLNDTSYAALAERTGWPVVYDITDDWTLAPRSERETERQVSNDRRVMRLADEVVVCSPALVATRGASRPVRLIPNGVDVEHFQVARERPRDLPSGRVVLYTGTAAPDRLDVALCGDLARGLPADATLVFVGPNACSPQVTRGLVESGAVFLGARPYADIPAYMQHSEVIVVPHAVTPFTESLDPIKAREVLAAGRPCVATPVAGFRDLGDPVIVAAREEFTPKVIEALKSGADRRPRSFGLTQADVSWRARAADFLAAMDRAARRES